MNRGIVDKTDHKVSESSRRTIVQPGGSAGSDKSPGKASLSDKVTLTGRYQLIERLEKTAAKLPAIDRVRVDAVKADIASGKYQIDVDNIADILLRTEKEFGD